MTDRPPMRVYSVNPDGPWSSDLDEVKDEASESLLDIRESDPSGQYEGPWIWVADITSPVEVELAPHGDGWVLPEPRVERARQAVDEGDDEPRVSAREFQVLRHALGCTENVVRSHWGYRNRYVADASDPRLVRLVAAGLMAQRRAAPELTGGSASFAVTRAGAEMIGLTPAQMRRAFEGES